MTNTDSDTTNASSKFDSSEGLRRFEKAPMPEKGVLLSWLRQMLLIREFEVRTMQAYQNRLIGGFCHIYIGQLVKGIGILAVDTVITVLFLFVEPLFFLAYFPLTIWACYDAYKLCKVYNNHIQQFGRPPKW